MMGTSNMRSGTTTIVGKGATTAIGPGPEVMAASSLNGNNVISADGDDVGKIKEIVLDVRSGRIAYAVLSSGGFLGMGQIAGSALARANTRHGQQMLSTRSYLGTGAQHPRFR
jgi:sporulation protein YlmC with PRC-barrel domain